MNKNDHVEKFIIQHMKKCQLVLRCTRHTKGILQPDAPRNNTFSSNEIWVKLHIQYKSYINRITYIASLSRLSNSKGSPALSMRTDVSRWSQERDTSRLAAHHCRRAETAPLGAECSGGADEANSGRCCTGALLVPEFPISREVPNKGKDYVGG